MNSNPGIDLTHARFTHLFLKNHLLSNQLSIAGVEATTMVSSHCLHCHETLTNHSNECR